MLKNKFNILLIGVIALSILFLNLASVLADDMQDWDLSDIKYLTLNIGGANILFDEHSNKIYFPREFKVYHNGDRLRIDSPERGILGGLWDDDYQITIGTAGEFLQLEINAGGIDVKGPVKSREIRINAGGMNVNADFIAERIKLNGAGLNVFGYIKVLELSIAGAGMDVDLDVEETERIELAGAGMGVRIKYLDSWEGKRRLEARAVGGAIDLEVPGENYTTQLGELDVDTSGFIDVDIERY